jgi:hypothetical protein
MKRLLILAMLLYACATRAGEKDGTVDLKTPENRPLSPNAVKELS